MLRKELGAFVRAARLRSRLSGQQLASKVHHSRTWVYRLEAGDRTDPDRTTIKALSEALELSDWEAVYMTLLAGRTPPPPGGSEGLQQYLDGLDPAPALWVSGDPAVPSLHNKAFRRVFKGVEGYSHIAAWLFECPEARQSICNWREIMEWVVSMWKYRAAFHPTDPALARQLGLMMEMPEFRKEWEAQTIPVQPVNRVVQVWDEGVPVDVDLRIWRRASGRDRLLIGVITKRTADE